MAQTLGVPKETAAGETRVALTPDSIGRLTKAGLTVQIEAGAGLSAAYDDAAYTAVGAQIVDRATALASDLVAAVQPPIDADLAGLKPGSLLLAQLRPLDDAAGVKKLADRGVSALALELVPRTTRAQRMDILSAMSTVAGYKAVLLAADVLPKFFPLLTTAAGTLRPAKVLILGAGVAGLQALATARRLGAITAGYDIRAAAREQVESVGAKFIEIALDTGDAEDARGYAKALTPEQQARQIELLGDVIATYDVVISTALIPGRPAPTLINTSAVDKMQAGSVIVDLAAANGGNCPLTQPDTVVRTPNGVTILGPTNLPAGMPLHASQMYARCVQALLLEFVKDGTLTLNLEDDILKECVVAHGGAVTNERVKAKLG